MEKVVKYTGAIERQRFYEAGIVEKIADRTETVKDFPIIESVMPPLWDRGG